jgi:hypothetical protein
MNTAGEGGAVTSVSVHGTEIQIVYTFIFFHVSHNAGRASPVRFPCL